MVDPAFKREFRKSHQIRRLWKWPATQIYRLPTDQIHRLEQHFRQRLANHTARGAGDLATEVCAVRKHLGKFADIAAAAGAAIIMGNQSQFDGAALKLRTLAGRRPSEPHPLEVGAAAVARYFKIEDECAQAVRLKLLSHP